MHLPPSTNRLTPYTALAQSRPVADRAEHSGSRAVVWLATLWIGAAFFLTDHDLHISLDDAYTIAADEMERITAGGNTLRQAAFLSLAALGVFCLGRSSPQRVTVRGALPVLMLLLAVWCVASTLWSADPAMTLRRAAVLVCLVLAAAGIGRQLSVRDLCHVGLVVSTGYLLIGIAAEIALGSFRPWAGDYRFAGSLHPNTQGMNLAVLCLSSFLLARKAPSQRWLYAGLFGVGLVFLVLTKSRTSVAGVLLALAAVGSFNASGKTNLLGWLGGLWIVATAALVVLLFGIDLADAVDRYVLMGRKEQAESLTGRLPIWTELAWYIHQRPLTGYGYDSFFTAAHIDDLSTKLQWGIREVHNAYIESLLTVGIVGAMLLLAIVVAGMRRAAVRFLATREPGYALVFGLLVFGLVNACTESGMLMPLWMPFFVGCGLAHLALVQREPADGRA